MNIVAGKSVQTLERPATENELGILKVSAVTWGEFRPHENKAMPPEYDPGDCPRPIDGDLLISRANTRELVGAPVMVRGNHPNLLLSDKLLKLIPDETLVDRRYLLRALRAPEAAAHFFKCAGGSSGSMTNITQADIRSAPIPLPPLPEQRRIAAILDKADALRTQRREALAQLDRLAQAIFVEMFGDSTGNPKQWPVVSLESLIASGPQNGLYKPASEYGEGVPILRIDAFYDGVVTKMGSLKRLKVSEAELALYGLREDDFVINRVNSLEYLGKSALIPRLAEPTVFESNMMRFSVKRDPVDPVYLINFLQVGFVKRQILSCAKNAVNQSSINQQDVKSLQVVLPPLHLQKEFASRMRSLDSLKVAQRAAQAETAVLFASLHHRAFRGEL